MKKNKNLRTSSHDLKESQMRKLPGEKVTSGIFQIYIGLS